MRKPTVPPDARHLHSYAELHSYLFDFVAGLYMFIWLVGRPGLGKTESIKSALRGRPYHYVKGGAVTPLQFYIDCYRHRGESIILDDAEPLLNNPTGKRLVSSLGDTSPAKLLSYATTTRLLEDVPQSFYTNSPLCILANASTPHADVQSRANILYFDPSSLEIHQEAATWFWDQEVHDWFGEHLYRLHPLDMRWYVKDAWQDKKANRDWRRTMLKLHAREGLACIVQDLESDPAYPEPGDRKRRFEELVGNEKGASRSSYFRIQARLRKEGLLVPEIVPPIPLRHTRPPGTPSIAELEAMAAPLSAQPQEEHGPADLPDRDRFREPIRGTTAPPNAPRRMILDDNLPWEDLRRDDEEGDE